MSEQIAAALRQHEVSVIRRDHILLRCSSCLTFNDFKALTFRIVGASTMQ